MLAQLAMTALLGAGSPAAEPGAAPAPALAGARQLLVVTTAGWDDVRGKLCRHERQGDAWRRVGECFAVVVGKKGMAWAGEPAAAGPRKREGDGRSPAGAFRLLEALGYAPAAPAGTRFPYREITGDLHCVDDPASELYNRIVRASELPHPEAPLPWKSSERMRRDDDQYRWLLVVDYNLHPPTPGAGSCIFVHVWRSPEKGTAGCTAMPEERLVELLGWLDPEARPALVLLPEAEYRARASAMGLPPP